jgi:predicted metallopeptidase
MAEEKNYTVITEAMDIIKALATRYPKELWTVRPETIIVLGITDRERPKSSKKVATIRKVSGATKALLLHHHIPTEYIIECYCADWTPLSPQKREWLLFHELLHVPGPDERGLIDHDVQDYAVVLDQVGLDWFKRDDLPLLTAGDPIPFKEELAVRLHKHEDAEPLE